MTTTTSSSTTSSFDSVCEEICKQNPNLHFTDMAGLGRVLEEAYNKDKDGRRQLERVPVNITDATYKVCCLFLIS